MNGGAGVGFSVPVSKILMEELHLISPPVASLSDPCISLHNGANSAFLTAENTFFFFFFNILSFFLIELFIPLETL